jgi:multimeric flavodoxin WrbA
MKIVTVLGSPRPKSNSTILAEYFHDKARENGAEIQIHNLNTMNFRGCQACDRCRIGAGTPCTVQDDLTPVLSDIAQADLLVMTSPVYFGGISAQLKTFFDRTRAFLRPDFKTAAVPGQLGPGKQVVFFLVQADSDPENYAYLVPNYEKFLKWYNYEQVHTVRVCGVRERSEINERPDVFEQIDGLAATLFAT